MKNFDIDDLSKNIFMEKLVAARDRLDSAVKLSLALGYEKRRVQQWLKGKMPFYTIMQESYPRLVKIVEADASQIEKILISIGAAEHEIEKALMKPEWSKVKAKNHA